MKKVYRMKNLDCANCAAKMEDGIRRLPGVIDAKINFMTMKFTLEAEDASFDDVLAQAQKICRKIEPDCEILA